MTASIGILGGTFDPIHYAHLRLAEEVGETLALAQVRFIPASIPPHRATPRVTAADRLAMTRLACADNPRFVVDERECHRDGPSYTVDTLIELRKEFGNEIGLCLLMGADAFALLMTWSRWERLFDLAHLVVAHRPGYELDADKLPAALAAQWKSRRTDAVSSLSDSAAGLIWPQAITPLDISATAIRAAIRAGRSPRYLLPAAVLDYIQRNLLYKDLDAG